MLPLKKIIKQNLQVSSIAILVLGIWTVVDRPYLERLLGNEMYMTAAYILIATGCIIFFISFLGCFGALKEIKCMLLTVSVHGSLSLILREKIWCLKVISIICISFLYLLYAALLSDHTRTNMIYLFIFFFF